MLLRDGYNIVKASIGDFAYVASGSHEGIWENGESIDMFKEKWILNVPKNSYVTLAKTSMLPDYLSVGGGVLLF